jgi:hypothetical protein
MLAVFGASPVAITHIDYDDGSRQDYLWMSGNIRPGTGSPKYSPLVYPIELPEGGQVLALHAQSAVSGPDWETVHARLGPDGSVGTANWTFTLGDGRSVAWSEVANIGPSNATLLSNPFLCLSQS